MGKYTAEELTEKWGRRTKAAIPDIVRGIDRVTESPMDKAADKAEKMLVNLTASVQDGTWGNRLRAVPLATWKDNTKKKVTERLGGGVDAAKGKHQKFAGWLIGRQDEISAKIKAMPDMMLEDNIARASAQMRDMASRPYKKES